MFFSLQRNNKLCSFVYDKFRENEDSKYIVVEGNRRLSTIQGLLNSKLKYEVPDSFLEEVKELPIFFSPNSFYRQLLSELRQLTYVFFSSKKQ
jgi:hypothetical protein